MNKHFIIVSHARFDEKGDAVHGTASELVPYLQRNRRDYTYIRHSLFIGNATHIVKFIKGKNLVSRHGFAFFPFPLRIMQELILTITLVYQLRYKRMVYIGIDPLNACIGVFLKKLGRVENVIFYTADYADKRFTNNLMNAIYHWFDRFCISHADQIWNVSSRITALRKKQGVPEKKNFFIPNAPVLQKRFSTSSNYKKYSLVIVTHITKAIDFGSIFEAIKSLKKKYKDIELIIVGDGPHRDKLYKKAVSMSLNKRIVFTGPKSHDEVMSILSMSGVGLAIYTNDFPWTKYGDSMKAREYLACGLPVIITDVPSTADDINTAHAGIVINSVSEIKSAIDKLFSNNEYYENMRNNALLMARKYDFSKSVTQTKIF